MEMMDALVKAAPEKGLVLTQVPKPVPGMGEVLIKYPQDRYMRH